jgi:predicted dehydrogenase
LNIICPVNLNMRLYPAFRQLQHELQTLPQFNSPVTVTINTGAIGIGANGIHYLDLLFFLLDADEANVICGEIDEQTIPSGRGPQFLDFGGWCVVKFYKAGNYKGKALLSLAPDSSAMGGWEFIGPNGRIHINEIDGRKSISLRPPDSTMPVHRYAADYSPVEYSSFEGPALSDLTAQWLKGVVEGRQLLPSAAESLAAHRLLFDWLSFSKTHRQKFPIT